MNVGAFEIEKWHAERAAKEKWSPYTDVKTGAYKFIGYHWVIRRNGVVESGRPESIAGCHTAGHNSTSIAICWIGRNAITDPQYSSLLHTVMALMEKHDIQVENVKGHREFPNVQKTCPNLDMNRLRENIKFSKV